MNKVVIITGVSSGIGLSTAKFLSKKGYKVYGLSRNTINEDNIISLKCDVTKRENVQAVFKEIYDREKRIDVVINNAGMGVSGAVEYSTEEELRRIFELNVFAVVGVCQEAIKYLRETKGKIINIGSVAGELTIAFQTYYSMTKNSIASLSEGLRMELRPFGIRVTTVLPGDTKTNFTKNRTKPVIEADEIYKERIKKSIERMEKDEQNGVDPIVVSKTIYRVIKKKNPPVKVTVGFKYKLFVFLKRIVPTRFVNYILYQMYGK